MATAITTVMTEIIATIIVGIVGAVIVVILILMRIKSMKIKQHSPKIHFNTTISIMKPNKLSINLNERHW